MQSILHSLSLKRLFKTLSTGGGVLRSYLEKISTSLINKVLYRSKADEVFSVHGGALSVRYTEQQVGTNSYI